MTRRALIAGTAVALLACYAPALAGMYRQWCTDEDLGHGFLAVAAIAWILWRERSEWSKLCPQPSRWGWVLLLAGAAIHSAAALGGGLFLASLVFLISVAGAVVCLGGYLFLRRWAFLFLLALLMLPKLAVVYNQVTLPLQLLASWLAALMLTAGGFGVIREGNILEVSGHSILVAEACSGIRYLLPLLFTASFFGYLSGTGPYRRLALAGCSVPLAIAGNGLRVALAAAIPAMAQGASHAVSGWIVFTLLVLLLFLLSRLVEPVRERHA